MGLRMPRKILALFANTDQEEALALGKENRVIEHCLRLSQHRPFELVVAHAVTVGDLRRKLLDTEAEVVHIACHGSQSGLVLIGDDEEPREVSPRALDEILSAHVPPLWVVVLNACYSKVHQAELGVFKVPYVVSMSDEIGDGAAIAFTRGFYDALAAGRDVEFSFGEGLRSMNAEGHADEVNVPALLVNQRVPAPAVVPPRSRRKPIAAAVLSPAIQRAETLLSSPDASERQKGLSALNAMNSAEATEALARALDSGFRPVRVVAALSLARRGDPRSVPLLAALLADNAALFIDVARALDGLKVEDRQEVVARAIPSAPHRALTYLGRVDALGVPGEAFSRGLALCIAGESADERAAAIIYARKFEVRDGVLESLAKSLRDERHFNGHIEALFGPMVCHQAAITIKALELDALLVDADHSLWEKRREEVSRIFARRGAPAGLRREPEQYH